MNKIKLYLIEVRAPFFTGVIVPILLGGALARYATGEFSWSLLVLTLIGGTFIHAAANVANDYFDFKSGTDTANTEFAAPFTGGSRLLPSGALTPREVFIEAMVCYAIGSAIGLYLAYSRGLPILWIGIFGVVTSYVYTAPPLRLIHRGVGEMFIGLNFGILPALGAYFVQAQELSWVPVLASLPVAVMIMLILFVNEFQDMNADRSVGKNNWVVRLGRARSVYLYALLLAITYLLVVVLTIAGIFTLWALAALLTIPIALKAIAVVRKNYDDPAGMKQTNALTIVLHLVIGLILCASFL